MARDVGAYLTAQQSKSPSDLANEWANFEELYNKRLWHQLTLKLTDFVQVSQVQEGDTLVQLYENFISDFENKINPLSLIEIVSFVVKQITDPKKCLEFVDKMKEKVKGQGEAVVLCNILTGQIKLATRELEDVKKLITETDELVENLQGITTVHGRFYQLCSDYHQMMGNHANYYRDALRYLGCTDLNKIPESEKVSRAFTLCLAALLGDGVYNFGELLAHPILESLKGMTQEWLVNVLYAFNSGSLDKFESLRKQWVTQPDLEAHEEALQEKIRLLCLMEMTFKRPGNQRVLTFTEIALETKLNENQVELLVMKALSLGLVKGSIDQVDKKVAMNWVQPRVLDKKQILSMKKRLDQWCKEVESMENLLESKAQDILT